MKEHIITSVQSVIVAEVRRAGKHVFSSIHTRIIYCDGMLS